MSVLVTRFNGRAWRVNLSRGVFWITSIATGALLLVFIISMVMNVILYRHYRATANVKDQMDTQSSVIQALEDDVQSLKKIMENLIKKDAELRQDLGRPKYRKQAQRRQINGATHRFLKGYPVSSTDFSKVHSLATQLNYLKINALTLEKNMRQHTRQFDMYLAWFRETPSIWPVYGYIRSGYGWRMHPLKRSRQFHKGIDIPAWVGAPVQATANGYVEFSGWGGGYGWMVVLSHQFGIKTFYAHLSEVGVIQGRRVNKGQIIGKIGTSGLSTGPHVHYEIRQRRKALSPSVYLDLDLFTAISKLW
jgi:murein DD-endopeptidase MepM/ murein hydrolase activator NlpD